MLKMFEKISEFFGFSKKKTKIVEDTNNEIFNVVKNTENESVIKDTTNLSKDSSSLEYPSLNPKSSVFSKWPSVIESLLKNKDESKVFWTEVTKEIPKEKCSYDKVNFYVQKFISWFGDKMLQDMIDWIQNKQIIWKIYVSHESEEALNAFNKFFSENLDDVLTVLDDSEKVSHKLVA